MREARLLLASRLEARRKGARIIEDEQLLKPHAEYVYNNTIVSYKIERYNRHVYKHNIGAFPLPGFLIIQMKFSYDFKTSKPSIKIRLIIFANHRILLKPSIND